MEGVAAEKKKGILHFFTQRITAEMTEQRGEKLLQKGFGEYLPTKIHVVGEESNINHRKIVGLEKRNELLTVRVRQEKLQIKTCYSIQHVDDNISK